MKDPTLSDSRLMLMTQLLENNNDNDFKMLLSRASCLKLLREVLELRETLKAIAWLEEEDSTKAEFWDSFEVGSLINIIIEDTKNARKALGVTK